ncbi:MAG: aspartyl protease family protein [Spartobacteria bacterium]
MRKFPAVVSVMVSLCAALFAPRVEGAVALSALDQFVVSHGYGGAQFVQIQNTYRLPINVNGQAGDLTIDTGAPTSIIFKAALKKYGLTTEETKHKVHGAFGEGQEKIGLTTIRQLAMGNCTLLNVKAAVLSDFGSGGLYRAYGASDGLFGLREMVKYGAVLDVANHLLLVHPGGPQKGISGGIASLLAKQGYTGVGLSFISSHLWVDAVVNGMKCRLIVDTGAFLTTLDAGFAREARIGGYNSGVYARGLGTKARPIRTAQFPEFKVGDFMIQNASVTITELDPELLSGQGKAKAAGLLGADYLGRHGAIFDFNNGTLYLRPRKKS